MSFLIIQTASIGDVILVTPVMETLHAAFPEARIDLLVKKGHDVLFEGHPFLHRVITWDKSSGKYLRLARLTAMIRSSRYQHVINVQRFGSTGWITSCSGARFRSGFTKNPFSVFFTHRAEHIIAADGYPIHEVDRNLLLIDYLKINSLRKPKLYPTPSDQEAVARYRQVPYLCIAPASLWFTKQFPAAKWIGFLDKIPESLAVYLIGSATDKALCEHITGATRHPAVITLAGKLSFLQTAALMKDARMNFVNDSAPQHLASAVDAPVSTIFCSTVPSFGFGPLSEDSHVIETVEPLKCRPCGLHGHHECPEKHFKCAVTIQAEQLLERILG
jgi:heptosyltransferase-2